jgi:UDP-N-acetylmuramyl tripeptide synthase
MSIVIVTGLSKLVFWLCSKLPILGGTALPGLIALGLDSSWIQKIVKKNKLNSIIISGTNGKTTTNYLLAKTLKKSRVRFVQNSSGSNLMRGIASTLVKAADWQGNIQTKLAIWEVDEAVVPQAIDQLKPKVIVFINLSRDQLDRYGEVNNLLSQWQRAINKLPKSSRVIVNAADPRLQTLKANSLTYFGHGKSISGRHFPLHLEGKFTYDSLWAVEAILKSLKLKTNLLSKIAKTTPPTFGRGERLSFKGRSFKLNLVKNPASFNTILLMLKQRKQLNQPLLICLNDLVADGTDVSWIWDVDFNYLNKRKKPIIVSGTRAHDLALRLKYSSINPKLIVTQPNLKEALKKLTEINGQTKYMLATYTAMRQIRYFFGKKSWS